jgi:hypothetical protein
MGQTIFSIDQILGVLRSDASTLALNHALLRFLVFVYITMSEDDDAHIKIHSYLLKDKRIWHFMKDTEKLILARANDHNNHVSCEPAFDDYIFEGVMVFILNYFKICCDTSRISDPEHTSIAETLLGSLITLAASVKGSGKEETRERRRALSCIDVMRSAGFLGCNAEEKGLEFKEFLKNSDSLGSSFSSPNSSRPATPPNVPFKLENRISEDIVGLNYSLQEIVRELASDKTIKELQAVEFDELGLYRLYFIFSRMSNIDISFEI